jgi:hypothetical protein
MLDDERAVAIRMNHILRRMDTRIGLDREIVMQLQQYFSRNNYNAREYRTAQERFLESPDATVLSIRQVEGGPDPRRYNMPRDNTEIAAVFIGEAEKQDRGRDLWIQRKGNGPPFQVSELHKTYLALHFPLIHPHGEDGWHTLIPITDGSQEAGEEDSSADEAVAEPEAHKRVTQRMWIAYHIHARKRWDDVRKVFMEEEEPSILLRAGKIFQEYLIDFYAQTAHCRLRYIALNQKRLRADSYRGLTDAVDAGIRPEDLGKQVILPSSFIGGPRAMQELFQDAVGIARVQGSPSYFITMTCNPKWKEIQQELKPEQTASDRPDLFARVFQQKLKYLLDDLVKEKVFGEITGRVHTIEFQKRGLPHAHILIIAKAEYRPQTAEDVDRVVSVEIPDRKTDRKLYDVVSTCMLYGPCSEGSMCWKDGACTKRFPKEWREDSTMSQDGYPKYRRRDDGRVIEKGGHVYDNRFVVPYNPGLSRHCSCHINVEVTTGVRAVKYIYKFIYKGKDRAMVLVGNALVPAPVDEIERYLSSRYLCAQQAAWRLLAFAMHDHHPSIMRLAYHLPGENQVMFDADANLEELLNDPASGRSMLTSFFEFCQGHPEVTRNLTYADAPSMLSYYKSGNKKGWHIRKRGGSLGRMYFAKPSQGERF